MRVTVFLLAALLAGPVWAGEAPSAAQWIIPPEPAVVTLGDLPKPPLVLHFWATWCAPCGEELPALDALAARLAIPVVAVSEDRGGADDVQPYLDHHPPLPHLEMRFDAKRKLARALGLGAVPVSVVIGADGRETARLIGTGEWEGADGQRLAGAIGR